jgi:hypothetical protein
VTVSELIRVTDLPEEIREKRLQLGIDSKTFLLELTKVGELERWKHLCQYGKKPFSREEIKEQRKSPATAPKAFKFNFVSDDKKVKINFQFKQEKVDRERVIAVLEKLIQDIKENKLKNLSDL